MVNRHLRLLGPVSIDQLKSPHGDFGDLPRFRSRRTMALLGYLAAERRPVARDHLAALFWPDELSSKARSNLRRELHNLSKVLPECWQLERNAVAFTPSSDLSVDIYQLLEHEVAARWMEAEELLGGEFLEGLYLEDNLEFENWLLAERERWRRRCEAVLTRVIEGFTRRGQYVDALRHCQRLLQLAPWNEQAHRQAMRLLVWTGQRGAALRQFEICKQALWEEMIVEPSAETIALYQQIRAGELDIPPQLPAFLTQESAKNPFDQGIFVAREPQLARLNIFLDAALAGRGRVTLITGGPGRGKTALMNAFAQLAMKSHSDLLVVTGNCYTYSGVGDPYSPFREVLAMLTGDVEARWDAGAITRDHALRLWAALPIVLWALIKGAHHLVDTLVPGEELVSRAMAVEQVNAPLLARLKEQVKRNRSNTLQLDQSHLFQQFTNLLLSVAKEQPLLLFLDDMQWGDTASIGLLFHLGRRLTEVDSRILIVCAYRPEEVYVDRAGERHSLAKPLSEFKRSFGDVWIDLGRSEDSGGRKFVDALLNNQPNRFTEEFRTTLYQRTEGYPLFTVELLRAMQERGDLFKDEQGYLVEGPHLDWELLPARVEAVIEERINRLDLLSQEMLTIASVEGEVFTAQVVAEVQNLPERVTLQKLSQEFERQHRLVSEDGEVQTGLRRLSRYRFGHVLFQNYLYKRISSAERRLLHGEVASALEKLYHGQLDELAVRIAHHFLKAEDFENSYQYFSLAAELAARVYATDEAIRHYTQALELAEKISLDDVAVANLHRGRGLAFETQGEFGRARADLSTSQQMARAAGDRQLEWRVLIDQGKLFASRDYSQTRSYFDQALEIARKMGEPTDLAVSLNRMGNWIANDEQPSNAVVYHQEALQIFEQLEDLRNIANTLDLLGIAHLLVGDYNASVNYYDRAIPLFRELDELPRLVSSLIGRGVIVSLVVLLAMASPHPPPDAHGDFREALHIARKIGSSPDEAWVSWALGLLYTLQGDFGSALKVLQNGVQIASEIGHREWWVGNLFASGVLYGELLAPQKALSELERALNLAQELQSQYWINHATGGLASAYLLLGDMSKVRRCLETVISPDTPMDTKGKRYCWARRAELALAQSEPAKALDIVDRLITTAAGMTPDSVITFLWLLKGKSLAAMEREEQAETLMRAARANAEKNGERFLLWRIHASLGRLYRMMGRAQTAEEELSAARSLIMNMAVTVPDQELKQNFIQRALASM